MIRNCSRRDKFCVRLPSYEPLSILFRLISVSTIAVVIIYIVKYISPTSAHECPDARQIWDFVLFIVAFNLLSELQIILDNLMERFFPVPEKILVRIRWQPLISILLIVFVFQLTKPFVSGCHDVARSSLYVANALGLVFITMFSNALLIIRFMQKWMAAQHSIEEMKREKLKMDYSILQDQLNPHFLFNNLSALKSLIMYDTDAAVTFTENFTDVYRYVLRNSEKQTVSFKDEMGFIDSYVGLHKERLGNNLQVRFSIDKASFEMCIAPLTVQLLVENAIKHNVASCDSPLIIHIYTEENQVVVQNNIQLKDSSYSTHTGLSNLVKRYEMLSDLGLTIDKGDEFFTVKVPLL